MFLRACNCPVDLYYYTSNEKPHKFERGVDVTFVIVVAACLGISLSGHYYVWRLRFGSAFVSAPCNGYTSYLVDNL